MGRLVSQPRPDKAGDSKGDKTQSKDPSKTLAEVTADGQTNRRDQASEEAAIVPNYNNFFTTYRLGPEDVISVTVFGQDRYSKSGITIPPSGRVSLALIPDGIFVNGKTVDQVAELVKKRYDEYIIDPQVSVSLDRAGSYRYSVIGDVAQPGIKLMSRRLSVTEALSEAGGVLQTGQSQQGVSCCGGKPTERSPRFQSTFRQSIRGRRPTRFIWCPAIRSSCPATL